MEKIRQNIFGIGEVYELQKEGQWVEKNRESYREYGYFGGGSVSITYYSSLGRIDYSNDTLTENIRFGLSAARTALAATGNSNFGYFGGGANPSIRSNVDRIDYSNDTYNTRVANYTNYNHSAVGNSNYGYFGGGLLPGTPRSTIDRIEYSNDLNSSTVRSYLTAGKMRLSATGNSNFGYFVGGHIISSIDRINYFNDTVNASSRGPLNTLNSSSRSTGNNNFGYVAGGSNTPGSIAYSNIERINYSNDTTIASNRSFLNIAKGFASATGNSNFGYFSGGSTPSSSLTYSSNERIDYSNDTTTTSVRGPLSLARSSHEATSSASFGGSPVSYLGAPWVATTPFGYFSGAALGALDRVDYTNDTAATTLRSQLSDTRNSLAATGNSSYGYYGGGGGGGLSAVERISYSNDNASASVRGPLSLARFTLAATGNSNFGYFGGGSVPGSTAVSTVDRINYTNDTAAASLRGSLSLSRRLISATGNSNFGYFYGGFPEPFSRIERIDYSNDGITASQRGFIAVSRYNGGSTGNNNFGYFAGGGTPSIVTTVDRIDYSNDTATSSIRGPLSSQAKYALRSTGNQNFGYFGGGLPGPVSRVDRIDYSNDTQAASARGPLSSARYQLAASSSQAYGGAPNTTTDPIPTYIRANTVWNDSNTLDVPYKRVLGSYGYFGGGSAFPKSTIDRIDYSNDLTTASIRGPLSLNRYQFSATGNSNFGYYIAGNIASPTVVVTSIDRMDYSNDGATALLRGNTTSGANGRSFGATGNSNFGYIGNWLYVSTTNRIDYSNDNLTASIRGPLSSAKAYTSATGNENFGYFGGGYSPGPTNWSKVDRIDYSNDLSRSSVRGPLSLARYATGSTGNSNFGYFGGGATFPPQVYYSTLDRIDYSNDTTTAISRSPLNFTAGRLAATGSSNFGYFGGGGAIAIFSRIDRLDYSNDTQTASIRGPLSSERQQLAASTNARNS